MIKRQRKSELLGDSFMMRKRDELGGKSPAEIILDESQDVKRVVDFAARDLAGDQGAL